MLHLMHLAGKALIRKSRSQVLGHAGWTIHLNPDNATLTWTSPTGRTYTTHPHDKRDTAA